MLKALGVVCIVLLPFVIFGITSGTLFFTGIIGLTAGLIYIITRSKQVNSKSMRIIKNSYIVVFICLLVSFISIETLIFLNMYDESVNKEIDFVVILGAGLNGNRPSKRLEGRLEKALDYIIDHKEAEIIVSGGQGKDESISEAAAMKKYMIHKGVDSQKIILEDQSTSTIENIKYTTQFLETDNIVDTTILLVTSDYHQFRAKMIAKDFGINVIGVSSKSPLFVRINYMAREYITVVKDWIYLKILR